MAGSTVAREVELSRKEICRFCLAQKSKLGSIYIENARIKSTASLPLQIMAITSIEVSSDDGMPSYICLDCRLLFEHCYRFKQMCKHAETLLRQYPLTGQWPDPLEKPRAPLVVNHTSKKEPASLADVQPKKLLNSMAKSNNVTIESVQVLETSALPTAVAKKLLNVAASSNAEPATPPRAAAAAASSKRSHSQSYQVKLENNQELSMDDVHNLIADMAFEDFDSRTSTTTPGKSMSDRPKVLNKSPMRLLNKGSTATVEPRLATPQIKHYDDGNVAFVTEILDPNEIDASTDPVKNTPTVATNVFPCPHCERSFPLTQLLDIHLLNHTRERSFKCSECDKSFFSKYDLQKHNFIHTGERPYKCSVCSSAFTRRALLHRHERIHTDVPKFICVYCEKPFISREEMEKHAERHTKKRPFQCGVCQKSFAFKQGLERHEVIHSSNLPFPCQYCSRSFVTAGKLARHLQAHAGKRAYPCKYCNKSYLLSHHLSRHLRMHQQAPATCFTCSICKDTHQSFDGLVDHSAIHASVSLKCPLCTTVMADYDGVEAHMQSHKDSERHACEFCDFIFLNSSQLKRHIEEDHVVDMVPYQNEGDYVDRDVKEEGDLIEELLGEDDEIETPPKSKMRKLNLSLSANPKKDDKSTRKENSFKKASNASPASNEGKRQTRSKERSSSSHTNDSSKRVTKLNEDQSKLASKQKNGKLTRNSSSK